MSSIRLGLLALSLVLVAPTMAQNTLPLSGEQTLQRGQRYTSASGHYAVFQEDGNLVVYSASGEPTWAFQSVGVDYRRVARVDLQADGNLAAYDAGGGYVWSALSANPAPGSQLVISPNGALQLVSSSHGATWSSDGNLAAAPAAPVRAAAPLQATAGWQVNEGSPARHSFGRVIPNGDNEGFLSGAAIPAANAAGWSAASGWPGASSTGALQWGGPGGTPCRAQANYTYFQTSIQPVPGAGYGIQFMNVDDAVRVSVMSGTSTINIPELVGLREPKTIDLTPFLVPNTTNRVVITLADVCGAGNGIRAELKTTPGAAAPAVAAGGETMTIDGTTVKTGPIQVTLEWDTRLADLDLFVMDPNEDEVGYRNQSVASGGLLDVDARAACEQTDATVENIIWQSPPPAGTYRIRVNHYQSCEGDGDVRYTVTLRRNGEVVGTPWTGTVSPGDDQTYTFDSE